MIAIRVESSCFHTSQTPYAVEACLLTCKTVFNHKKCTKFGQLVLRKIIEFLATRCQILRLKCTKFNFGWGSSADPAGRAYSAPPDRLAGFKGPTSKGREGRRKEGDGGGKFASFYI